MKYVILISLSCLLIACSEKEEATYNGLVLQGATLYNGVSHEPITNGTIVIKNGRIDCVGSRDDCTIPDDVEVIDVTGKFITPGLVDAHIHFDQTGFFDGRPDALDLKEHFPVEDVADFQQGNPDRYYQSYLCSGVTAVYDVGGRYWTINLQKTAEITEFAPHVAAAGPLITAAPREVLNLENNPMMIMMEQEGAVRNAVREISSRGSTGIKIWFLPVRDESSQPVIDSLVFSVADEAERQSNQLIVHATSLREAKVALKAGAKVLVHSVWDQVVDDEFLKLAINNDVIYTPTMIVPWGYYKAFQAVAGNVPFDFEDHKKCVDDKTRELLENAESYKDHLPENIAEGLENRRKALIERDSVGWINAKKVFEAGIRIAVGTDAGNPGTLHGISIFDEMEKMEQAGIPAAQVIIMATQNGARAMNRYQDFGSLEAGKMADLIILDKNPGAGIHNFRSLKKVMKGGRFYQ